MRHRRLTTTDSQCNLVTIYLQQSALVHGVFFYRNPCARRAAQRGPRVSPLALKTSDTFDHTTRSSHFVCSLMHSEIHYDRGSGAGDDSIGVGGGKVSHWRSHIPLAGHFLMSRTPGREAANVQASGRASEWRCGDVC